MSSPITINLPPEEGLETRKRLKQFATEKNSFIGRVAIDVINAGLDVLEKKATRSVKSRNN